MKICILFFSILTNLNSIENTLFKGKRAQEGQFPWLIQFQTIAPCGGVLLSLDWVLTAAQCVQDKRHSIVLFATGLNGTKQTVSVKATYIHPRYKPYSISPDRDYNIALLKLTKPFNTCNVIFPNIPVKYDNNYAPCLIFGWQSYVSSSSKVLAKPVQYSEVIPNSWKLCTYMIKLSGNYTNYTNAFCAMVEIKDEMKTCAGNPGSPLVCKDQHHETVVIGIASWTNFSLECGDLPTYVHLDVFRMWINDLIFNGKETDKQGNKDKLTEKGCEFVQNTNIYDKLWNNTNILHINSEVNYRPENSKIQSQNISKVYTKYFTMESMSNSYGYEEIDKSKKLQENKLIKDLNEGQSSTINKSLQCNKQLDKIVTVHKQDEIEIDNYEFWLPLSIKSVTTSHSTITVIHCRSLYLLFFILCYVYIITYIQCNVFTNTM